MVSLICFFLFNRLKWFKILSLALCIRGCTNIHQWGEQHYQATVYQVNTLINWSLIIWSLYKVEHLGHFICERKEPYRVDRELTIIQCGLACLIFLMLQFYFHGWAFRESNCYFKFSLFYAYKEWSWVDFAVLADEHLHQGRRCLRTHCQKAPFFLLHDVSTFISSSIFMLWQEHVTHYVFNELVLIRSHRFCTEPFHYCLSLVCNWWCFALKSQENSEVGFCVPETILCMWEDGLWWSVISCLHPPPMVL